VDACDAALNLALRFLAGRARSEAEIATHLESRGVSPAVAAQTMEKLRAWRYTGDQTFAREWARSRAHSHGFGPHRIAQELHAKGIDDAVIGAVLKETFPGDDESRQARTLLEKQFGRTKLDDPKNLRRAAAFLQRRGYSETVIVDILGQPQE
jgi:regulatory protein